MDEIVIGEWSTTEVLASEPEAELFALEGPDQELIFVGDVGIQGAPGKGIPTGGSAGQYLKKVSGSDYDTQWVSTTSADAHFEQAFTGSFVAVTHNLGKYPSVTVLTSAGDEVEGGEVDNVSVNQLTVSFSNSFSGVILCN